VPALNILLTSTAWRNDHNGFSHQGPGLIDTMISLRGSVVRVYLPPDANTLLSVADHCFRSRDYVNLIVADKQAHLQYLDAEAAAGISEWEWASTAVGEHPDIVLTSVGDVPTLEALAAASVLREYVPELRVRFVNVVDLMALMPPDIHPHGLPEPRFEELFGASHQVLMAFHGYARAVHQLLHGRPDAGRFHVRGFNEQGTTTTPFDMVVLNRMSRYQLALEALNRSPRRPDGVEACEQHCREMLGRHSEYVIEHLEDMPEIRDWTWPG
jgi:xylulose-5-phosphate/fructose-6-phosphate phosphoketolase